MGQIRNGELDLDSLICAPLIAVAKANEAILKQQTQFVLDTCFTVDRIPVMVNMRLSRMSIDGAKPTDELSLENQDVVFQVPLISLLPINSLGDNSVDVDFNFNNVNNKSK